MNGSLPERLRTPTAHSHEPLIAPAAIKNCSPCNICRDPVASGAMIDQETKSLAIAALRRTLTDPDAKPADKLRAAGEVIRLEADQRAAGLDDTLDASDEELLAIARGQKKTADLKAEKDLALAAWLTN